MITKNKDGFVQEYRNPLISKISFFHNGTCTVYYHDGKNAVIDIDCEPVFQSQFGIPLSRDGTVLFVGSWEKGVTAFSTTTGNCIWRFKSTRIRQIFVFGCFLLAVRTGQEIVKLELETGRALDTLRSGTIEEAFLLTESLILVHSIKGKLALIEPDTLTISRLFSKKEFNPNGCLSQIFLNAALKDGSLILTGFEASVSIDPASPLKDYSFCRAISIRT